MANVIIELSKYIIIILIALYTYQCFSVFANVSEKKQNRILKRQNRIMYVMQFIAYLVLLLNSLKERMDIRIPAFYLAQLMLCVVTIHLYRFLYPKVSRVLVNNMCMLLSIGFIMLCRLDFDKAIKQFVIVAVSIAISMLIPVIIRKLHFLDKLTYLYAAAGIVMLLATWVVATPENGAQLSIRITDGFSLMPAEFVKIIFVFFVAAMLSKSTSFRQVIISAVIAGAHVLILVASTDLGPALILFIVYVIMVYVATKNVLYLGCGLAGGSLAAVLAYFLFRHVKVRVLIWKVPFAHYDTGGYQIAQSLFAIVSGGWFGSGLGQGSPKKIPEVAQDAMFPAIAEELGIIFGLCLILICISCFIMFLNIAMQLRKMFYKLIALGLGTAYIFQIFLTIGGSTKFIPLTGVTLPLISYGGSSILGTLIIFAIIQGLYILREDEDENLERERQLQEKKAQREQKRRRIEQAKTGGRQQNNRKKTSGRQQTGSGNGRGKEKKEKQKQRVR